MLNFEAIFENRSFAADKLLAFGFSKGEEGYLYSFPLSEKSFELRMIVSHDGKVMADVIDVETGEVYALVKVHAATGPFVGKIRTECEALLSDVAEKCFFPEAFKSPQAKQIIAYIREKYGDELEFLWPKFSQNAIVRRKDNAKWYVVFLTLPRQKLGLAGEEKIGVLDLRIDTAEVATVVDGQKYFPGFHMNKKHWLTVCLDGSVSVAEICGRIDDSYLLAQKR